MKTIEKAEISTILEYAIMEGGIENFEVMEKFGERQTGKTRILKKYRGCKFHGYDTMLSVDRKLEEGPFHVYLSTPDRALFFIEGIDFIDDYPVVKKIIPCGERSDEYKVYLEAQIDEQIKKLEKVNKRAEIPNDNGKVKL